VEIDVDFSKSQSASKRRRGVEESSKAGDTVLGVAMRETCRKHLH
jgi:hypothetical protein